MKNHILSERVNLFEPNVYIQFLVQIGGKVSPEALKNAVETAYTVNEATMSRIVLGENGEVYYERMRKSGCKAIIMEGDFQEIIRENEKLPFEINRGELMRAFIIPSKNHMALLLMAHHLAGDGKSMVYFLSDVMNILAGKEVNEKPMKLMTKESFPKKSPLSLPVKLLISKFNRSWRKNGRVFTWEEYAMVHEKYWKAHSSQVLSKTFSKGEFSRIKENAKEAGVSINSYVITAFLQADKHNHVVGIPVDVREQNQDSMSNQVGGLSLDYRYSDKKTFAENAKAVHQKIYKQLKTPAKKYFVLQFVSAFIPSLIDSVLLCTHGCYQNEISEKLAEIMVYTGDKTRDLGVTNLGILPISGIYGEYKIEKLLFLPPAVSYARHIIGMATLEGEMTIVYRYMNESEEEMERGFFERGIRGLVM